MYWGLPADCSGLVTRDSPEDWFESAFVNNQTGGWFGFGLPPATFFPGDGHVDTDMMVFSVDPLNPSRLIATDMWSFNASISGSGVVPDVDLPDGVNNVVLQYSAVANGQAFAVFRRRIDTGSPWDRVFNLTSPQACLFAFNSDSVVFGYHGSKNVQIGECNWGNVTVTPPTITPFPYSLVVAHGVIGALGVGLFLTLGVFVARYGGSSSFMGLLKNLLFCLGVILILISFVIAGVMVSQGSGLHYSFSSPSSGSHSILSLITFMSAIFFIVVYFVTERLLSQEEPKGRASGEEDGALSKLGRGMWYTILAICILTGWPAIFLGFVDLQSTDPWLWVIGGILIGVAVIFLLAEILRHMFGGKQAKDKVEVAKPAQPA